MRRTLALLLALVMALSCFGLAFAEEEEIVSEAVEEVVPEAEFDLGGDEEEVPAEEVPAEEEIVEEVADEALLAAEYDHGVVKSGVLQFHCGEEVKLVDVYGYTKDTAPAGWTLIQQGACGTGVATIWRFKCTKQMDGDDTTIHEIVIAPAHVWASEVDPKPVEWGKVIKAPTCTEDGLAVDNCLICGKTNESKTRVIKALDHSFNRPDGKAAADLVITKLPTCAEAGKGELRCTDCGAVLRTETINYSQMFNLIENGTVGNKDELVNVTYDALDFIKTVKFVTNGKTFYTNKIDGVDEELIFDNYLEFAIQYAKYAMHDWDGWINDPDSTCYAWGTKIHFCKRCGAKDIRDIEPKDPQYVLKEKIIIDCYHYAEVYECKLCGSKEGTMIDKDGKKTKGTPHPVLYKIVQAVSHEPDPKAKAAIDEWYEANKALTFKDADPDATKNKNYEDRVLTNTELKALCGVETDIPVVAVAPRCESKDKDTNALMKGVRIYPCAHEKVAADHEKKLAQVQAITELVLDGKAILEGMSIDDLKAFAKLYEAADYVEKQHAADTKYVVAADAFDGTKKIEDTVKSKGAMRTALEAPLAHKWSEYTLRYKVGEGDNEYGYWIRSCNVCGETEELVSKTDPNTGKPAEPANPPAKPATIGDVIEEGAAVEVKDTAAATVYYVRVSTTYVLANGTELNLITAQPVVNGKIQLDDIPGATVKNRFAILTTTSGSTKKAPADLVQLDTKSIK